MKQKSIVSAALLWSIWILSFPVESSGEPPRPVGTVTAISGQATVTRATPQPTSVLKFRDPIFSRDRVTTRERSFVRVLYGGKALLTLQESTDVSVTAEPHQATAVHLAAGTMALALAPAKKKGGEGIVVRTPNATAAVRGTVILVEVAPASDKAFRAGEPSSKGRDVVTTFHVLNGRIDVTAWGNPGTPPISLGSGLSLSVTGQSIGKPHLSPPIPNAREIMLSPQHTQSPEEAKKALRGNQEAKAVALTEALTLQSALRDGDRKKTKEGAKQKAKGADPVLLDASQGGAEVILKVSPKAKDQKIQDLKLEDRRENVIIPTTKLPGKTSP